MPSEPRSLFVVSVSALEYLEVGRCCTEVTCWLVWPTLRFNGADERREALVRDRVWYDEEEEEDMEECVHG